MSSLICRKCNSGIYLWDEPTRSDFENRRMKCEKCGNVDTIKELYEGAKNTEQQLQPEYVHTMSWYKRPFFKVASFVQWLLWKVGIHWHMKSFGGQCTPDFSCCKGKEFCMKIHVICCNDSVEFAVVDDEQKAAEKLKELAEEHFRKNIHTFADRQEYKNRCYWHIHTVAGA